MILEEGFGALGMLMILGAFWLVSTQRVSAQSWQYQLLNVAGSAVLAVYSVLLEAWASLALNVVWGLIALNALREIAQRRERR